MNQHQLEVLNKISKLIDENEIIIPEVLSLCSIKMEAYRTKCKKQNDVLAYEALGDAVHILGMKRKPKEEVLRKHFIRIKKSHFPNGIEHHHHTGERNFYKRYLEEKL